MHHESQDRLLDPDEAAKYLKLKTADTLAVWRSNKRYGLPYLKVGRSVRYRLSDIKAWLESRTLLNGEPS